MNPSYDILKFTLSIKLCITSSNFAISEYGFFPPESTSKL